MNREFALSERELSLRDAAEAIARDQQRTGCGGDPLSRRQLLDLFAKLRPLGYLASVLPREESPGPLGFAALVEGLSPALALVGNHSVQRYLHAYATNAQQERFLSPLLEASSIAAIAITEPHAGADLGRIETKARRTADGFVLSGSKTWVTHGLVADVFVVLALTEDGPTRFIVPADVAGLQRSKLDVIGLEHLTFAELRFNECRLSADLVLGEIGQGLAGAKTAFPIARALAALQSVQLGEAALDLARNYAQGRNLFGRDLAESSLVQSHVAEQSAKLAGARLLAYRAIAGLDGVDCAAVAAQAKALACRSALDACSWALELSGSAGLNSGSPLQQLSSDARMMAVVDGTVVLNHLVVARRLLRRSEGVAGGRS